MAKKKVRIDESGTDPIPASELGIGDEIIGSPTHTKIVAVIDKSSSMGSVIPATIIGYNKFLEEQASLPGEANITLILFDTLYVVLENSANIKNATKLTTENYIPQGNTALYDSIACGIAMVDTALVNGEKPGAVVIAILTDGEENSSREVTGQSLGDMISYRQDTLGWKFVFLGANQDAFKSAGKIGIDRRTTMSYDSTNIGTQAAFTTMSRTVKGLRKQ